MSKVKVIATIGPASTSSEILKEMVLHVDGIRINFSHGDEISWRNEIKLIKSISSEIPILGDLRGPCIRIGNTPEIEVKPDDVIEIKYANESNGNFIPIPKIEFFKVVDVGDVLLMDDGRIKMVIEKIQQNSIKAIVIRGGIIKSNKVIHVRGKEYPLPIIDDHDLKALKIAIEEGIEYVCLSHVRNSQDIEYVRKLLNKLNVNYMKIVSKIESISSMKNLDEILENTDFIMIARGDLGMNFNLEDIPKIQKQIIQKSLNYGKPVMVATQLLESMIENPIPTRAEVVDITNAVLEGVDALVLTGETAIGKYPIEAVKWIRRIIEKCENDVKIDRSEILKNKRTFNIMLILGLVQLSEDINSKIVIYTNSGNVVEKISIFRPKTSIYVGSNNEKLVKQLKLFWNVKSTYVISKDYDEGLKETLDKFIEEGEITKGDIVTMVYGFENSQEEILIRIVRI